MKKMTINKIEKNIFIKSLGNKFSLQLDIDERILFVQMSFFQFLQFVFPILEAEDHKNNIYDFLFN